MTKLSQKGWINKRRIMHLCILLAGLYTKKVKDLYKSLRLVSPHQ